MLNDHVVITGGSRAVREITAVRTKGMWGRSGGIDITVLDPETNGRQIRPNDTFNEHGQTGTASVVGEIGVLPIAGLFVTGTSAHVPPPYTCHRVPGGRECWQFGAAAAGWANTLAK